MAGSKKQKTEDEGLLVAAAKKIGKAAGKVAVMTGTAPKAAAPKRGKLAPKNKARLPRKQKKAQKKAQRPDQAA